MGVTGVLQIYKALMFEGHVVFVSSDMSKLSACALASLGLLYPFSWQHFFVPNLPIGMLDYVTAPMPFCLGLHASLLDTVLSLPIEESLVIVKIDDGEVAITGSGDSTDSVGELPQSLGGRLEKAFTKLHKDWRQGKLEPSVFNRSVLDEVVNAMVGLLCDYREFVGDESENAFDVEGLIESFVGEDDTQEFFRSLEATQHFDIWRQNCVTLKAEGYPRRGLFETGISERNYVEEDSGTANIDVSTARKLVDVSRVLRSEGTATADMSGLGGGVLAEHIRSHEIWKNLSLWDGMFEDMVKTEASLEHLQAAGSPFRDSMRSSLKSDRVSQPSNSSGSPGTAGPRSSGKLRNSMRRASAVALAATAFQGGGDKMGKTKAELEAEAAVEKAKKEAEGLPCFLLLGLGRYTG